MALGGAVVTRLRAPSVTGPDGVPVSNWRAAEATWDKVDYPGSQFQPISSTEDIVAQQRTESTHRAFLPAGADVLPTDRLRYRGADYQVEGEPERWADEHDNEDHVEVRCFRIQGG
jgi:hypothetical protein